jgi:hypothetical protein
LPADFSALSLDGRCAFTTHKQILGETAVEVSHRSVDASKRAVFPFAVLYKALRSAPAVALTPPDGIREVIDSIPRAGPQTYKLSRPDFRLEQAAFPALNKRQIAESLVEPDLYRQVDFS